MVSDLANNNKQKNLMKEVMKSAHNQPNKKPTANKKRVMKRF